MQDSNSDLDRIRDALRSAIERTTLRAVAIQIGMSPTGLQEFVAGANPYGKTREKVRTWFYHEAGMNALASEEAARILRRLVVTIPDSDGAIVRLLDSVESAYQEAGMFSPAWIPRVRELVMKRGTA